MLMNFSSSNFSMSYTPMLAPGFQGVDSFNRFQQSQGLAQTAEMMMRGGLAPSEQCSLSATANALILLSSLLNMIESMMGAECPVPWTPNFGDTPSRPSSPQKTKVRPAGTKPGSARIVRSSNSGADGGAKVRPLAQSNGVSCGQTSVAMCVNSLTGKKLTDQDIHAKYGFGLLSALNGESRGSGYTWSDAGDLSAKSWPTLEKKLNQEKTPVMIGLNGQFSPSGRGHIVTLLSIEGEKVTYADPADGKIKTTTKQAIEKAPPHPDGKFLFVANKV